MQIITDSCIWRQMEKPAHPLPPLPSPPNELTTRSWNIDKVTALAVHCATCICHDQSYPSNDRIYITAQEPYDAGLLAIHDAMTILP